MGAMKLTIVSIAVLLATLLETDAQTTDAPGEDVSFRSLRYQQLKKKVVEGYANKDVAAILDLPDECLKNHEEQDVVGKAEVERSETKKESPQKYGGKKEEEEDAFLKELTMKINERAERMSATTEPPRKDSLLEKISNCKLRKTKKKVVSSEVPKEPKDANNSEESRRSKKEVQDSSDRFTALHRKYGLEEFIDESEELASAEIPETFSVLQVLKILNSMGAPHPAVLFNHLDSEGKTISDSASDGSGESSWEYYSSVPSLSDTDSLEPTPEDQDYGTAPKAVLSLSN